MALTIAGKRPYLVTGTTATSQAIVNSGTHYISKLYWKKPTTEGHLCTLQDGDGKELHSFYCKDADVSLQISFEYGECQANNGIYCDDMDSGVLYVHTY